MPRINVLPKNISDLIAAGEVVERPSSVVKEFLENSIDAGAKKITVEINNGGKSFIRVTDDGCGISREDVKKAFLSHATSKIKPADDLDCISTLGFRGEALPSICAVSKVELLTRTPDSDFGTRYVIEGGEEVLIDDAGCPAGTTFLVRDLFFNIPARMKFLKKDAQEGNYISSVLERVALSHPEISIKFIRDGKIQFTSPGDGDLSKAIFAIFGKEFNESLLPVDFMQNGIKFHGFVSKPIFGKKSRTMQIFFVNNRYVKIPLFVTALETAYKNSIMAGKFPACVLFCDLPYSAVDVNVHPSKTEVRFFEEKRIFDCLYQAVFSSLNADTVRPSVSFTESKIFIKPADKGEQLSFSLTESNNFKKTDCFPANETPEKTFSVKETPDFSEVKKSFIIKEYGNSVTNTGTTLHSRDNKEEKVFDFLEDEYIKPKETVKEITIKTEKEKVIPDFRIIGEAFKTYIFAELSGQLLLIDKHAAHERIIFNRLKENAVNNQQLLLQPVIVTLSADEYNAVIDNLSLLCDSGYDISDFGNCTVKVSSCPAELVTEDLESLITEIAGYLSVNVKTVMPEKLDWIYHSSACRAAIKSGHDTTLPEMEELVRHLLLHDEIKSCPHGRPVAVQLTKYELEKLFKRIV